MHKGGTGQRWAQIEDETLQKHNLSRLRTENAPLEQTFVRPDGRAYRINLTFLAPRANLARVLASAFWITHQDGCRQATVITMAHCLRMFNRFLNDRAKSQPDLESARGLSADLLKELAVWLLVKRSFKRKTAAGLFSMCCCFLRKARRLYPEEFDPSFSTPSNMFPGVLGERSESKALSPGVFQKILTVAEQAIRQDPRSLQAGKRADARRTAHPVRDHDCCPHWY